MKRLCLAALFAALIAIGWPSAPAQAQGCGPQNPNCIVTTMPNGDASRRAASDQFVQNAIAGVTANLTVGTTAINGGSATRVLFDNAGVLGEYTISGTGSVAMTASPTFTGTLTAATVAATTINAFTLAGTISGGGNQINNVNIGNVSPGAGGFTNLFASAVTNLGTTITPQASDVLVLNNNASGAPAQVNGFSPNFRIIGKDGDRPPMSIQGFGSSAEPTILLMHARGTGAAPTASQSGDFVGELFAHPCGNGTTPCTYMHDVGAGVIWRMLENATTTAGEAIDIWATPIGGTTVALAATFGGNGTLSTTNSITVGTVSPASGTVRGVTINGAAAGSGAGSSVVGNDGGSNTWAIGSYTAILGGTYTNQTLIYSASGNYVFRPAASVTPANNGDLMIQGTSNTSLTFKFKGSDGTVRSASLTLS